MEKELKWKKNDQGTEGYGFGKVEIGLQQKEVKNLANDKKNIDIKNTITPPWKHHNPPPLTALNKKNQEITSMREMLHITVTHNINAICLCLIEMDKGATLTWMFNCNG